MRPQQSIDEAWAALPAGARSALDAQWRSVAAGGLGCGSAIVGPDGAVVAAGRNCVHDLREAPGEVDRAPLYHTRLAHAEMNALARVPAEADHAGLTLWSTHRPCRMCAAALEFAGIPDVRCLAEDPSDAAFQQHLVEGRALNGPGAHGDALWWTVCNLLFLHNPAVRSGADAQGVTNARPCLPRLAEFVVRLAATDTLGQAARAGTPLPDALRPIEDELAHCVAELRSTVDPLLD